MGQIAMPSPTPSASEPSYSFAYSDSVGALPPTTMNSFDGLYTGRWGYDTPPLDEACVYGVDTKIEPGEDQYQQLQQLQLPQEDSVESSQKQGDKPSRKATRRERRRKLQFTDLKEPLSEWGRRNGIEPIDVHSFATRDIEKRIGQATRNGYIKRNLNVFFLYKRAYSNVAQAWMEQHHPELAKTQPPIVSLVGESWAKESATFKGSYTIYSELEKAGLRDAFPDYKYRPGAKKASGITKSSTRGVGGSARSRARTSQPVPPRTQTPPCSSSEASTSVGRHSRFHTPLESTPLPVTPQPYQYRSAVSTPFYDDDGDEINGLQVYYDTPSSHYGASPSPYVAYDGSLLGPTPERHLTAPSAFEEAMARSVSPQPNGLMSLPVDPVMSVVPGARGYMPSPARSVDAGYTVTWEQVHSSTPEYEPAGTSVPASHPYHESQRSSHLDSIADSMLSSVPMGAERCGFAADEHAWRMDTPAQDEAMRKFTFALDDWSN